MKEFMQGVVRIKRIVVSPFDNNVYLLIDQEEESCIVVDAANDAGKIISETGGAKIEMILQTHMHMDHTGAITELMRETGAPVCIHPDEPSAKAYRPLILLHDGMEIKKGRIHLRVLHTPGHTPGSVCFLLDKVLFCGDTLFPGGPGKTSGPEDFQKIVKSIIDKIYCLPDETLLLPGHGESTTVGKSRMEYSVFAGKKRDHVPWGDVLWLVS